MSGLNLFLFLLFCASFIISAAIRTNRGGGGNFPFPDIEKHFYTSGPRLMCRKHNHLNLELKKLKKIEM